MENLVERYKRELQIRNYAEATITCYVQKIKLYLDFKEKFKKKYKGNTEISVFLHNVSQSYEQRRTAYFAVRTFYRMVLRKRCPYQLDFVKKRKRLPMVLTKPEIIEIFKHIQNKKHHLSCRKSLPRCLKTCFQMMKPM